MAIHYATEGLSVRSGGYNRPLQDTSHCWKFSGFSTVTALRGPTERSIFLTMTATMMTGISGWICHRASYKFLYLLTLRGYSVLSSDKLWHKENKNRGHERMSI